MNKLENKVAIITGSGSGIGRETALLFAEEGAKVVVSDIDENGGKETVEMIKEKGGEASYIKVDVTDSKSCENMITETISLYDKLDIIFNNAGYQVPTVYDVGHMPEEIFDRSMAINVKGVWNCIHFAAKELVKSKGVILNMASYAATSGGFGCSAYGTSKGAVRTLTFSVANELGIYGVRCNCLSPYTALTQRVQANVPPERLELTKSGNALFELIDVQSIAKSALYLVSDDSKSVTGFDLRVDAGAGTKSQPRLIDEWKEQNPYDV